jgi:hypothetical protein
MGGGLLTLKKGNNGSLSFPRSSEDYICCMKQITAIIPRREAEEGGRWLWPEAPRASE